MTARLVLVCDVCGAVTDDHYAHPVADARFRARATGWTRRRHIRKNGDRLFVDLCPEHTYHLGFVTEPNMVGYKRPRPNQPRDPQPLEQRTPTARQRFEGCSVVYKDGDGPYRLYTALAAALRSAGATRGTLEQVRREMFAPGADFLATAQRWVQVETEERRDEHVHGHDEEPTSESGNGRCQIPCEGQLPPGGGEGAGGAGPVDAGPGDPGGSG